MKAPLYKTKINTMVIRTILFYVLLALWTILMGIICFPYLFVSYQFLRKPVKGFHFGHDDGTIDEPNKIGYIKPLMIVIFRNGKEKR